MVAKHIREGSQERADDAAGFSAFLEQIDLCWRLGDGKDTAERDQLLVEALRFQKIWKSRESCVQGCC